MRRALAVAAAVTFAAACGDGGSDLSQALCADLDNGLTLMNIYGGNEDRYTPEEFASQVFVAVDNVCPKYRDDPAVRNLLEGWGYLEPGQAWPD